jgi:chromatin remodeling complex protein RSC6
MDTRQIIFRYKEAVVKKDAKQLAENYSAVMTELGYYTRLSLTRPIRLSDTMAKFFGSFKTTNIQLINLLNTYINTHALAVPFTKLFIVDDALAKAFGNEPGSIRSLIQTIAEPHVTILPISSALKTMSRQTRINRIGY